MTNKKGYYGGRVDKDGFHKLPGVPDYVSVYPTVGVPTGGIVVKLGTGSLYGQFGRKVPHIQLGFKYRNPEIYCKWYRPTMIELHLAAMSDPLFAYYLWKWNGYTGKEVIVVNRDYMTRKVLCTNSDYGKLSDV